MDLPGKGNNLVASHITVIFNIILQWLYYLDTKATALILIISLQALFLFMPQPSCWRPSSYKRIQCLMFFTGPIFKVLVLSWFMVLLVLIVIKINKCSSKYFSFTLYHFSFCWIQLLWSWWNYGFYPKATWLLHSQRLDEWLTVIWF